MCYSGLIYNNLKQSKVFKQFFFLFYYLTKLALVGVVIFVSASFFVLAQTKSDFGVAYSYKIIDEDFDYGDIISYNKDTGVHNLSKKVSDSNMFGVAVETPVLLFRSGNEGKVPVVQSGKVLVNVTTVNGPIKIGDYITSSSILGKGQKALSDNVYVLGFALEPFGEGGGTQVDEMLSGKILVMLNIEEKKDTASDSGVSIPFFTGSENKGIGRDAGDGNSESGGGSGVSTIKYTIAAIIAIASIFIALRNFMTVINKGVVSVGRNPLAKSSVWSIVVFNTIIALVISVIGVLLSLIIISLPF